MSWRPTGSRPWQERHRRGQGNRGQGGRKNHHNRWEDWPSQKSRPWRSRRSRNSPLRTKIYPSHRDESSDEEVRAEKLKTASLVKSRLNSLTVEDKSESMKQLLVTSAHDVHRESPTNTKDQVSAEKESRRIAHTPKPIKPVPPPPNLPPLLAEQLEIGNDVDGLSQIMPQRIDRKLLQDLIALPIADLKKMVDRPTSKDNLLLKDLMKNTRISLTDAMRRLAEHKLQNFGLEDPFTELENLVDPDLAIDVCSKPVETIQALMDIFNLNLDGDYDNMDIETTAVSNLPIPENIEYEAADLMRSESRVSAYQWHSPCSIETNKSFLNCFNEGLRIDDKQSCVKFSPEIKIESPPINLGIRDSPILDPFINAFTFATLPQPVPPPESLDVIMERSKRDIDMNKLSDQLQDSINKLQKIATEEHNKFKKNNNDDASNSPAQGLPDVLSNQLNLVASPSQRVEKVPSIVNKTDTRSTYIKTLALGKGEKPKMSSPGPNSHPKNHIKSPLIRNQETVKNKPISVSTQTRSIRCKDSSTQKHAQKLISQSSQASPLSLTKGVQTSSNAVHVHASIQTNNLVLRNSAVQTDSNNIIAETHAQSKSLVDKYTQHTVTLSHRGEQTNNVYITSNKFTQTKEREIPIKSKNDILAKKEEGKLCPTCKASFTTDSSSNLATLPSENISLFDEFSILRNDIKSLGTGSPLRRRLISSVLELMSSTFINFYNLFNEVAGKSKSLEKKEKTKVFSKIAKIRKVTQSPSNSNELDRKKIKLENPKIRSSLTPERDIKNVENPKTLNTKGTTKINNNRSLEKIASKREMKEETLIAAKKLKRKSDICNIPKKKMKHNINEAKNEGSNKEMQMLPKEIVKNPVLEEEEELLVAQNKISGETKSMRNSERRLIDTPKNNENNPKSRCNSFVKEDEQVKESANENVFTECPTISEPLIKRTDEWYKQMYKLRECSVSCSKLIISSSRLVPIIDTGIPENDAELHHYNQPDDAFPNGVKTEFLKNDEPTVDNVTNESNPVANFISFDSDSSNLENNSAKSINFDHLSKSAETNGINDFVCKVERNDDSDDITLNSAGNSCPDWRSSADNHISNLKDNIDKSINPDPLYMSPGTNAVIEPICKVEKNDESENITQNSEHEKSLTTASELSNQDSEEMKRKLTFSRIEFVGHNKPVTDFKVSGNHVLAASGNDLFCFSFKSGKRKRMYSGHKTTVTCLCSLAKKGGEVLFSGSHDQVIRAFSVQNSSMLCSTPDLGGVPKFLLSQGNSILDGNLYAFLDSGILISLNPKMLKIKNKYKIGDASLLCAAVAEINNKKTIFISTENCEVVSKEIDSESETIKLDWGLEERAERLIYHGKSLYCGSKLPHIIVFNFTSDLVSKNVINCLCDPVSLCIVEYCLLVGSELGKFELFNMESHVKQAEFSIEEHFNLLAVHKKIIIGHTIDGKLIARPLPQKVRKILQV